MRRPHIGFALRNYSSLSGASVVTSALGPLLAERGWEVSVFSHRFPDADGGAPEAAVTRRAVGMIPFSSAIRAASFDYFCRREARRAGLTLLCGHGDLTRQDICVLNNCDAAEAFFCGGVRPPSPGTRYVRSRQFGKGAYRKIVAVSRRVADDCARFYGVPEDDIQVIYWGVDLRRFHPANKDLHGRALRRRMGIPENAALFLSIISGNPVKRNIAALLDAVERARVAPAASLLLVGPESVLAHPQAKRLQHARRLFHLPGSRSVEHCYAAADAFILPAKYEEFGLTALEAMASGLAVVVSSMAGASELLQSGDGIILRDPASAHELSKILEELAASKPLREELKAKARRRAEQFPWSKTADQWIEMMDRLRPVPQALAEAAA